MIIHFKEGAFCDPYCRKHFVLFTTPERMDAQSDYIYSWDKKRLLEMADFRGKIVLDVGSGSGRLAFAAAEQAAFGLTTYRYRRQIFPMSSVHNFLKKKKIFNIRKRSFTGAFSFVYTIICTVDKGRRK